MSTVIYHKNDYDGLMSGAIMLNALTVGSWKPTVIGWDYGDPVPEVDQDTDLFLVDISIEELMEHPHLHWVDHHKTAIDKWDRPDIPGYRLDGVAACRLCWQYMFGLGGCPPKNEFVDRVVDEPLIVLLLGEYDVWDHRDERGKWLQLGLQAAGFGIHELSDILRSHSQEQWVHRLVSDGAPIAKYLAATGKRKANEQAYLLDFNGLRFAVLNQNSGNSLSFDGYEKINEVDALMIWRYDAHKGGVVVSMYHAPHRTDLDLSNLAIAFGGGGHRGACGFLASAPWAHDNLMRRSAR